MGVTGISQAVFYLTDHAAPTPEAWLAGALLVTGGVFLLAGFLTPFASGAVALSAVAAACSWISNPTTGLFDSRFPVVLVIAISIAVALLGPGSFSVDSHLFGRREVIIPRLPSDSAR